MKDSKWLGFECEGGVVIEDMLGRTSMVVNGMKRADRCT